jgi:rare lipoprotein A
MRYLLFILLSTFALPFQDSQKKAQEPEYEMHTRDGKATYYASYFNGRRTASGEIFSNKKFTAAHRKLPFGTKVTVLNKANGRTVVVRINDRGPFNKRFIIDLSQAAARELGFYSKGVASVEITYALKD